MPSLSALSKLKALMLKALTPVEGVEGSVFKALRDGEKAPSGERAISSESRYKNPDVVYPVYHGAREISKEPLKPYSESHNDVTTLFGERRDPRPLAYATVNPKVASLHAYGVHDFAKEPNLRAYVGRNLPQLYMGDFSNFDISEPIRNLTRGNISDLFEAYGVSPYSSWHGNQDYLKSRMRKYPELAAKVEGLEDLSAELQALKDRHIEALPPNYIQYMTDIYDFDKRGNPKQKEMYQLMLSDPEGAIRSEQLIPLKGEYAEGGAVDVEALVDKLLEAHQHG